MIKKIIVIAILAFCILNIDICLGVVLDADGNGRVLNGDHVYNYIKYDNKPVNDLVLTICIMNPLNLEPDDVLIRIDL